VKVKAEPPLEKEPVPKGLVRVSTLLDTVHAAEVLITPDTEDKVQDEAAASVIPEGKVISSTELDGI
jgi:hypothetical protein